MSLYGCLGSMGKKEKTKERVSFAAYQYKNDGGNGEYKTIFMHFFTTVRGYEYP